MSTEPSTESTATTTGAEPQTTVDIVIRLQVAGSPADVESYRDAIECLADVMRVQAEDGLWSLGQPEAETDDGPSEHLADIEHSSVQAVLIGEAALRRDRLAAIADELAAIANRHRESETIALDDRVAALSVIVRELDALSKETP